MKVRADFVTNSSSCGYILLVDTHSVEDLKKSLIRLENEEAYCMNGGINIYWQASSVKELQEYVTGRPIDWASKPRGIKYINMEKEKYESMKQELEETPNTTLLEIWVDYNCCDKFEADWSNHILEIMC